MNSRRKLLPKNIIFALFALYEQISLKLVYISSHTEMFFFVYLKRTIFFLGGLRIIINVTRNGIPCYKDLSRQRG